MDRAGLQARSWPSPPLHNSSRAPAGSCVSLILPHRSWPTTSWTGGRRFGNFIRRTSFRYRKMRRSGSNYLRSMEP
eukprot:7290610-Pyramimonas_sp.AAC.1